MPYTDSTALKLYLGIPSNVTTDDSLLTALITRAQKAIDSHCRRTFEASADTTRYVDGNFPYVNGRYLNIRRIGDLCQITTVTNGNGVIVTAGQYVTDPRNETPYHALKLKDNVSVAWTYTGTPENAIAIVGRWAYSITAPADVVHAAIRLSAFFYRQKDSSVFETTAIPSAGVIEVPTGMPKDVSILLKPYVRLI
jgi:hypothetical protein